MRKKDYLLYSLLAAAITFTSCDYNEKHFPGFDDNQMEEVVQYEGEFKGSYPTNGYFTVVKNGDQYSIAPQDAQSFQTAINKMMNDTYPYADNGTAKIQFLAGEVTPGMDQANESYVLAKEDYDSMGEGENEPGEYNNFTSEMDIDAFLITFCNNKFADKEIGTTLNITYAFYQGSVSNQSRIYEKTSDGWIKSEMTLFTPDKAYTLGKEDYDSMGTESGNPGRYDNFDESMNVNFYLAIFLKEKFPYAENNAIYSVDYKFYVNKVTETRTAIFRYQDGSWNSYNPYEDEVKIFTLTGEFTYDKTNWVLKVLVGSSINITFTESDYKNLFDWVIANKAEYKSNQNDYEEFYIGVSTKYNNINNKYSTWKKYYNINNEYDGLSDEQLQAIMDQRLADGIATQILPKRVSEPDTEKSYVVTYKIYGGRGDGNYSMSFIYSSESQSYKWNGGPVAAQ